MTPAAQFTAVMRAPIVRIIDDQTVTFPTLTAAELAELGEIVRAEFWELAQKNPKGATFTDIQWFRVRQEIDESVIPITEIIRRVSTMLGAAWVIRRGLVKAGFTTESVDAIMESISPLDLRDLAELVSRIRFVPKTPKPDAGDSVNRPLPGGGNPPADGAAGGEVLTGEPSPTNSGELASMPQPLA